MTESKAFFTMRKRSFTQSTWLMDREQIPFYHKQDLIYSTQNLFYHEQKLFYYEQSLIYPKACRRGEKGAPTRRKGALRKTNAW